MRLMCFAAQKYKFFHKKKKNQTKSRLRLSLLQFLCVYVCVMFLSTIILYIPICEKNNKIGKIKIPLHYDVSHKTLHNKIAECSYCDIRSGVYLYICIILCCFVIRHNLCGRWKTIYFVFKLNDYTFGCNCVIWVDVCFY